MSLFIWGWETSHTTSCLHSSAAGVAKKGGRCLRFLVLNRVIQYLSRKISLCLKHLFFKSILQIYARKIYFPKIGLLSINLQFSEPSRFQIPKSIFKTIPRMCPYLIYMISCLFPRCPFSMGKSDL